MTDHSVGFPIKNIPNQYWSSEREFTGWLAADGANDHEVLGRATPYLIQLEQELGLHLLYLESETEVWLNQRRLDITGVAWANADDTTQYRPIFIEAQFDRTKDSFRDHHSRFHRYLTAIEDEPIDRYEQVKTNRPIGIWLVPADPGPDYRKDIKRIDQNTEYGCVLLKPVVDEREDAIDFTFEQLYADTPVGTIKTPSESIPWRRQRFWAELVYWMERNPGSAEEYQTPDILSSPTINLGSPPSVPRGVRLRFRLEVRTGRAKCIADFSNDDYYDEFDRNRFHGHLWNLDHNEIDRKADDSSNPQIVIDREINEETLDRPEDRKELREWFMNTGDTMIRALSQSITNT